jgi:hypothetical protein
MALGSLFSCFCAEGGTQSVKDAKTNDPDRFSKKGSIYYDPNLHHNVIRNTDTTGALTDLPAKDTLPN